MTWVGSFTFFVQAGAEDFLSGRCKDVTMDPNDVIHIALVVCACHFFPCTIVFRALMITCNCVDSHLVTMLVRKGISLSEHNVLMEWQ